MNHARRIDQLQFVPAERAIFDAAAIVEAMPADVRLTDAVILLGKARERVADFVDGVPRREDPRNAELHSLRQKVKEAEEGREHLVEAAQHALDTLDWASRPIEGHSALDIVNGYARCLESAAKLRAVLNPSMISNSSPTPNQQGGAA